MEPLYFVDASYMLQVYKTPCFLSLFDQHSGLPHKTKKFSSKTSNIWCYTPSPQADNNSFFESVFFIFRVSHFEKGTLYSAFRNISKLSPKLSIQQNVYFE